jgi:excisionase family DNA binding protein
MDLRQLFQREPRQFITRKEAAYLLGCSVSSISRYIARGGLKALQVGNRVLVYRPSVLVFPQEL